MSASQTFVVVGAGLAGARAAETLRAEGFDGRIVLIGEDTERPYERPPLSKEYLRREGSRDAVFVDDEGSYAEHGIELRTGTRATALDPVAHTVTLAGSGGSHRLAYDRLLLTTGSAPRRIDVPGADLPGVLSLRSLADADRLHDAIAGAARVAIVGAGWLGCEVAASARQLDRDVALIAPSVVPLERVLGVEVGWAYRNLHADHGVELHFESQVRRFVGTDGLESVELMDGTQVAADVALVAIGASPCVGLAVTGGLAVDDGIVVDQHLTTSHPDVFAAGDVAAAFHPAYGRSIRLEHWANAQHQGPVAARNMLGRAEQYDRLPYFFSDQYDLGMEYSGYAPTWDRVVFRGYPSDGAFLAFWMKDGVVVAGMNANVWDVTEPIQRLVRARVPVDPTRLSDPGVPIEDVGEPGHAAVA